MSWHGWSLQPSLAYVVVAGCLFWLGGRGFRRPGREQALREGAFAAGLITLVLALDSPLDGYADQLFWVHMIQHILLLSVAPPLILLGRPWPRMWRSLPLPFRTAVGRGLSRSRWAAPLRALAHPLPSFILFNATLIGWHLPAAYNATLGDGAVHDLEHAMFFFTGLLFWARVVDPGPLRSLRLEWPMRIAYLLGSMTISWIIALTLVMIQHPIYSFYADLAHRPGGITAETDQQLAGGGMWVLGSVTYGIALIFAVYRWLTPSTAAPPRSPALTT